MVVEEIKTLLVSAGIVDGDLDVYYGDYPSRPPVPHVCTVIADTLGGLPPFHTFSETEISIDRPRIQIKTRGLPHDYLGPCRRINRIYQLLTTLNAQSVSGTRYMDISAIQAPFTLGEDDEHRWEFFVNFEVMKAPASAV